MHAREYASNNYRHQVPEVVLLELMTPFLSALKGVKRQLFGEWEVESFLIQGV